MGMVVPGLASIALAILVRGPRTRRVQCPGCSRAAAKIDSVAEAVVTWGADESNNFESKHGTVSTLGSRTASGGAV